MSKILQGAMLCVYFAVPALRILDVRIDLDPSSLDGKFQTYGAISLLASDAVPFRDFPLYLGAGVTHAAWLTSVFFGSNVLAVQQAAIALTSLTFAGAIIFFMRVAGVRPALWPAGLAAIAMVLLTPAGLEQIDLSAPGASLMGVRVAAVPIAGAVVLFFETQFRDRPGYELWGRGACWGILGGGLLLWANDFGIAAFLALALALVVLVLKLGRGWRVIPILSLYLASAIVCLTLLLALMGSSVSWWVQSNFVATAGDQWWLFHPWYDASRVFSITDLVLTAIGVRPFLDQPELVSIVLAALVHGLLLIRLAFARSAPSPEATALGVAVLAAWGGGLIATVGGHFSSRYWGIFVVTAPFAALVLARMPWGATTSRLASLVRAVVVAEKPTGAVRIGLIAGVGGLALIGFAVEAMLLQTRMGDVAMKIAAPSRTPHDFGGWRAGLTPDQAADARMIGRMRTMLDHCDVPSTERLIESYPSLFGSMLKASIRPEALSIIHVLGADARRDYLASMANRPPLLVATISPDYSPWAEWLIRARSFWYDPVLANYVPFARTDQHTLWLRRDRTQPLVSSVGRCRVERVARNKFKLSFYRPGSTGNWGRARLDYTSAPVGGSLTRPVRTLVTVSEDSADATLDYGAPSQGSGEVVSFAVANDLTTVTLRSGPEASQLSVSRCEVEFITLPETQNLPRLGSRADLIDTLRRSACGRPTLSAS